MLITDQRLHHQIKMNIFIWKLNFQYISLWEEHIFRQMRKERTSWSKGEVDANRGREVLGL
jgi:hypothetical protein